MKINTEDKIVQRVIEKLDSRSAVGLAKYKVSLYDDTPELSKWLNHLQEELLDACNYIEKLKMEAVSHEITKQK